MFTADLVQNILSVVRPPFTALLLYGSYARGDANEASDIDVLQVTPTHTAPYSAGGVNITCYTSDQLLRLARRGSLFVRHLIEEARPITDPEHLLLTLKSAYITPADYSRARREVCECAPLLDIDIENYHENPGGYSSLVSFLVRTYLYALAFDNGAISFSMKHVLDLLGRRADAALLLGVRQPDFSTFLVARKLFQDLTGSICHRTEGSLEAFIVNAENDHLAAVLGLRLLARGRLFTYDALRDVEL